MHDQTSMCTEGIAEQFRLCPRVKAEAGEGYQGLASEFPDQVSAPPRKPKNPGEGAITEQCGWRQAKRRQSSPADRRRTRKRRTASMAPLAALDRTPPGLRRNTLRNRRPGL
jgi:hypothetical protein